MIKTFLVLITFIVTFVACSDAVRKMPENKIVGTLHFVDAGLAEIEQQLFGELRKVDVKTFFLECQSLTGKEGLVQFITHSVLQRALDSSMTVYTVDGSSTAFLQKSPMARLRLIVDEWDLEARDEKLLGQSVAMQYFRTRVKYQIIDANQKVLLVGAKTCNRKRSIAEPIRFQADNGELPQFAQTRIKFKLPQNGLIKLVFLTVGTATTVFLFYSLRSQ